MARNRNDYEDRGRYHGPAYGPDAREIEQRRRFHEAEHRQNFPYGSDMGPRNDRDHNREFNRGQHAGWSGPRSHRHDSHNYGGERMHPQQRQHGRDYRGEYDFRSSLPVPYGRPFGPQAHYHDFGGQDHGFYDSEGRGLGLRRYTRYRLPGQR